MLPIGVLREIDGLGLLQGCRRARVLRSSTEPKSLRTLHLRISLQPLDGLRTFLDVLDSAA